MNALRAICSASLVLAALLLGTLSALGQAIDMNMTDAAEIGTSDGWFLLPSKADAVLVCFPEGEGTVSLWSLSGTTWTRTRPFDERTTMIGGTLPASPDSCTTVLADDCFWWPAAGDVWLIFYKRTEATRVLAYWHEAKIQ